MRQQQQLSQDAGYQNNKKHIENDCFGGHYAGLFDCVDRRADLYLVSFNFIAL